MSKIVQFVRMLTGTAATYTGPEGMVVVDQGTKSLRVQDGATPGGFPTLGANNNLSDLPDKDAALSNLGCGSAATQDIGAFDANGAANAALASANTYTDNSAATVTATAAADATTKANNAQATAISTASADATTKANAAQAAAQASSCQKASNLSDVSSPSTAYANLGGKSMGTRDVYIQSGGSPSGGNDGDIFLIY